MGYLRPRPLSRAGAELSPELLGALLDAERLLHATSRAEADAHDRELQPWREDGHSTPEAAASGNAVAVTVGGVQQAPVAGGAHAAVALRAPDPSQGSPDPTDGGASPADPDSSGGRKAESARVLGLQPNKVGMYVPGAGVRSFHFGVRPPPPQDPPRCTLFMGRAGGGGGVRAPARRGGRGLNRGYRDRRHVRIQKIRLYSGREIREIFGKSCPRCHIPPNDQRVVGDHLNSYTLPPPPLFMGPVGGSARASLTGPFLCPSSTVVQSTASHAFCAPLLVLHQKECRPFVR